jgi:hypothetical protein
MSKKIQISSRGMGKIDRNGNITDYTVLSYDLVTPPSLDVYLISLRNCGILLNQNKEDESIRK